VGAVDGLPGEVAHALDAGRCAGERVMAVAEPARARCECCDITLVLISTIDRVSVRTSGSATSNVAKVRRQRG
jgi:hypothetical protein